MAILRSHGGNRVGFTNVPDEGPLSVGYYLNFSTYSSYYFNIVDFLSKGEGFSGFTSIQSLWIDNSANNSIVTIYITQTNQTIEVPALSQGYYPILSPEKGQISISASSSSVINFAVLNFQMESAQWFPSGTPTSIIGIVNVNVEGMTFTGGYLNTLDATLAAIKGTTTSSNAIPTYNTNNPTSIEVSNTVSVAGSVSVTNTVPVSGSVSVTNTVPISGSISVIGQTYNGSYLNTQDSTLAAIKGTTTTSNALPIYNSNNNLNTGILITYSSIPSGVVQLIPATGSGIVLNSINAYFGAAAYYSSGIVQSLVFEDGLSNVIFRYQLYLPTGPLTVSATQASYAYTILNFFNQNLYIPGGLYLNWNAGGLSASSLNINVTYRQSNGN